MYSQLVTLVLPCIDFTALRRKLECPAVTGLASLRMLQPVKNVEFCIKSHRKNVVFLLKSRRKNVEFCIKSRR